MKKLALFTSAALFAAAAHGAGDPDAGKQKSTTCTTCHGNNGISAGPTYPNLAGQKEQYLVNAIQAYRDKKREGGMTALMYPMVGSLSDQDIEDLAAYYSSLPSDGGE